MRKYDSTNSVKNLHNLHKDDGVLPGAKQQARRIPYLRSSRCLLKGRTITSLDRTAKCRMQTRVARMRSRTILGKRIWIGYDNFLIIQTHGFDSYCLDPIVMVYMQSACCLCKSTIIQIQYSSLSCCFVGTHSIQFLTIRIRTFHVSRWSPF